MSSTFVVAISSLRVSSFTTLYFVSHSLCWPSSTFLISEIFPLSNWSIRDWESRLAACDARHRCKIENHATSKKCANNANYLWINTNQFLTTVKFDEQYTRNAKSSASIHLSGNPVPNVFTHKRCFSFGSTPHWSFLPSIYFILNVENSSGDRSSKHATLTATKLPTPGLLSLPNAWTPQVLQNNWW